MPHLFESKDSFKENFKEELLRKIVEFFLLTTSFVVESKEKESNSSFSQYRKRNEVYYEKNIAQSRKYICFDVLSIFYNLVNVAQSYGRFDKLVLENSREVKANEEKELNKEQDAEQGQIKEQEQRQEGEQEACGNVLRVFCAGEGSEEACGNVLRGFCAGEGSEEACGNVLRGLCFRRGRCGGERRHY